MQTSCQGAKMSSKVSKQILCHFIKRYLEVALLFEGFFFWLDIYFLVFLYEVFASKPALAVEGISMDSLKAGKVKCKDFLFQSFWESLIMKLLLT